MLDKLASAVAFDRQALGVLYQRQGVLAGNIANADTPDFKARDFNFSQALAAAAGRTGPGRTLRLATTDAGQLEGVSVGTGPQRLLYREPDQRTLDGNTVEMNVERAAFADNTVRYETALSLLNTRFRNLRAAMQPEQS